MSSLQLQYASLGDLSLGLFSDVNELRIPVGGASACQNVVWVDGYLRGRAGLGADYEAAPNALPISHLSMYSDFSATRYLMRVSRSGSNLLVHRHDGTWTNISGAGIAGASATIRPTSCNFKGHWWLTTGDGELYRYDGTTLSDVQTLQATAALRCFDKPQIVVAGDSRLFIADCHDKNDGTGTRVSFRVAWSDFLNGLVWGGGDGAGSSGYIDLGKDSSPITGMYYSNSNLLVFKANSVYLGYAAGPPKIYDFREIVSGVGCIAHATIKQYREGMLVWLGDDNIYVGGTNREPQAVGDRIRPRIREVALVTSISKAVATIDRVNHLYTVILPGASGSIYDKTCVTFTLNLRNGSWWEGQFAIPDIDVTAAAEFRSGPWSTKQLLATQDGKIYDHGFGYTTDNGSAISCSWTSGWVQTRSLTKTDHASYQELRGLAPIQSPVRRVDLALIGSKGIDRPSTQAFGTQTFDGVSDVYTSNRPYSAEAVKVQASRASAEEFPSLADLGVGWIPLGHATRK